MTTIAQTNGQVKPATPVAEYDWHTTHLHVCPRCGVLWQRCQRTECQQVLWLCAACEEVVTLATGSPITARFDAARETGALVRCASCRRLHSASARH